MENLNEEKVNSSNNKNNTQQKSNNNKMNNQNLNSNQKEDPYINIIKNNPEFLFDFLSNDRIKMWELLLKTKDIKKIKDDNEILMMIPKHELQTIIKNDCERTRKRESILIPGFKKILENMLTYYCEDKKIKYKQSINEIFGPLLLIKYKIPNLKYFEIYNLAESFINIYLENYYINPIKIEKKTNNDINNRENNLDQVFYPVFPSLELFHLLLKYHEPSIFNSLDKFNIHPKLYAFNWFMTCFSSQLKLNILYLLYDYLIQINDPLFLHYFFLALIIFNRTEILKSKEKANYYIMLSKLTIETMEELTEIMSIAMDLREETPFSFRILANKLGIFQKNISVKELYSKFKDFQFDTLITIPIYAMEIFYITYKDNIKCPDIQCKKNKELKIKIENHYINKNNNSKRKLRKENENYICEHCDLKILKKRIKYILVDLGIYENLDLTDENEKLGFLPNMIMFTQKELQSEYFPKLITERFKANRGNYHFIFFISENFQKNFENFYEETNEENFEQKQLNIFGGGGIEEKIEKKINFKNVDKFKNCDIVKLKEYDNFKSTIKTLLKENFPFISFCYGGYKLIHDLSFILDLTLPDHDEKKCFLCNNKKNKNTKTNNVIIQKLWEHKKTIKYDEINELCKVKENFICFCSLYEKEKNIEDYIQILICVIFKDFKIQIYENKKKKIYDDVDNIKNKKDYDLGNEDTKDEVELILMFEINISNIKQIKRAIEQKNLLTIELLKSENQIKQVTFDFPSKNDSKQFINYMKNITKKK